MPAQLLRQLEASDVKCEAGTLVNDADVRCNIEQHTLVGRLEPESVENYCCGDPTACPTLQAAKKVEEKGGDLRKILASIQDKNRELRAREQIRQSRLRRAQRLMVEDSPEGRAFRKKLLVGEFDPARKIVEAA